MEPEAIAGTIRHKNLSEEGDIKQVLTLRAKMTDGFGFSGFSNGAEAEEDPAAAFLAQQQSEIAGIESEADGLGADGGRSTLHRPLA